MRDGHLVADSKPSDILSNQALLKTARLEPPLVSKLFSEMNIDSRANETLPITIAQAKAILKQWKR
jgi:hypothetical protein